MGVFALGDLHLSGGSEEKSMDIFSPAWRNHADIIRQHWLQMVTPRDTVIIPGDITWAQNLAEAREDLAWLGNLPGTKVLVRGNHDYWWSGINKVRRSLPPGVVALRNDYWPWNSWAICGTRGWVLVPGKDKGVEQDEKLQHREVERLRLSLHSAVQAGYSRILLAMHYPPLDIQEKETEFTRIIQEFPVKVCVYGHLHGDGHRRALEGWQGGVHYRLVAADAVGFAPVPILEMVPEGEVAMVSSQSDPAV